MTAGRGHEASAGSRRTAQSESVPSSFPDSRSEERGRKRRRPACSVHGAAGSTGSNAAREYPLEKPVGEVARSPAALRSPGPFDVEFHSRAEPIQCAIGRLRRGPRSRPRGVLSEVTSRERSAYLERQLNWELPWPPGLARRVACVPDASPQLTGQRPRAAGCRTWARQPTEGGEPARDE